MEENKIKIDREIQRLQSTRCMERFETSRFRYGQGQKNTGKY